MTLGIRKLVITPISNTRSSGENYNLCINDYREGYLRTWNLDTDKRVQDGDFLAFIINQKDTNGNGIYDGEVEVFKILGKIPPDFARTQWRNQDGKNVLILSREVVERKTWLELKRELRYDERHCLSATRVCEWQ